MRKLLTRAWTVAEIETLIKVLTAHLPVWRTAHRLRRSQSSVRPEAVKLALRLSPSAPTANP